MRLDSISQLYSIFQQHPVVCTDSRKYSENSIFFALKGENFNANAYALGALEKGCSYAVIDEEQYELDDRFILVDNVLETLQQLGTFHRRQLGTLVIGITGTNGKTTTKELIASVLKERYTILYTQGNLNNHIGVPLTLLKLTAKDEIAVVEMGASHPGEIKALCEIARPDYGLITNVGKAHLEGFGSFEGVMKTKAELYDYIARSGKLVFINKHNSFLYDMAGKAELSLQKMYSYIGGKVIAAEPFLEMECNIADGTFAVKTNLIGTYNAENVLAAATIGHFFKLSNEEIKQGLENYVPQNNRSQFIQTARNQLIVDAYNANPTSMALAVNNFAQMNAENKMAILGDMLELGSQSEAEHLKIVEMLASGNFKNVLLVGSEFKKVSRDYPVFDNVSELKKYLQEKDFNGYQILIKGSRGVRLEEVIKLL